ncbi:SecA cross-linking domain protein [Halobacteriovorax sp. BALOs_7]|uniref:preprotein translocase subunit SecA n=1 Tax=unclassified Halobacteriovorax TaxID=2639665 RepID=UPI000EA29AB4|nr:preprotein translocase subunit SecA [Halobacteriovorax sp. BALOs_7]AYF44479.1 SecA cross-linking domain protein [Halobacteriovorax sp. BALOs_7]
MFNPLKSLFGTKHDRDIKKLMPIVNEINSLEAQMEKMSDDELKAQTPKFKKLIEDGAKLDDILPEVFATVREASKRVLGMRPYDVQIIGGIVLYKGIIAEMKTGEGKTLTAALPLYLKALEGKGAHLVTVNDYLAQRDAKEMGELYNWLGLSVGCIIADMEDEDRQKAYGADITYGTNNEFAFDYLRDNMKFSLEEYVQRDFHYCIVDEVDSILIDEARTPLLISGPSEGSSDLYGVANQIIPKLTIEKHFTIDEKAMSAIFTEEGILKVQEMLKVDNLFDVEHSSLLHHLNQALRAHHLFKKDANYIIKDGEIIIVDEFTGRLKTGSRWSDGLHQAIEAKEGVEIKQENQTLASITFQNYFKMYANLAGMTGTADTEAEEFKKIYNLDVIVIPTNLPIARIDEADVIYKNKKAKHKAIINLIKELNEKGQPVLVGTITVESSNLLSAELEKAGIKHNVLNAKQHGKEAGIIENAGVKGTVTIATNMAGRGTDIKINDEVKSLGGLYILCTERHESRRIDNQLRGRSGRQGDPGHSKFFLSLEDDLMRIFGSDRIAKVMNTLGMEEDEPIEHSMITNAIAKAQKKVETHNFEIRKHLLDFDNVMNEQRRVIYRIRRDILSDNDNRGFVDEMTEDVADDLFNTYRPQKKVPLEDLPWEDMKSGFSTTFNTDYEVSAVECSNKFSGDVSKYFEETAKEILKSKLAGYDEQQVTLALREILLSTFDQHWKDHLRNMDHLKEGINLKAYAQKDPLNEYKREAFGLFEQMRIEVKKSVVRNMFTVKLYTQEEIEVLRREQEEELQRQLDALKAKRIAEEEGRDEPKQQAPRSRGQVKVGRNDPCPCGSGKKYKHCHGS